MKMNILFYLIWLVTISITVFLNFRLLTGIEMLIMLFIFRVMEN